MIFQGKPENRSVYHPTLSESMSPRRFIAHPSYQGTMDAGDANATKVRMLKMDSPKGETPQTEINVQKHQDSEIGFPQRGDPGDRNNSSEK